MSIEITITDNEFQDFIIHSERYVIGRSTYVVNDFCETVKKYLERLSNNTLSVLIHDIDSELEYELPLDSCWRDLLFALKVEYSNRKGGQYGLICEYKGNVYLCYRDIKIKTAQGWVDGVRYYNDKLECFVRVASDFDKKFKEVPQSS